MKFSIEQYFLKNTEGKYEATDYLVKLAFNDFSNLWLLCHCCNLDKRDKTPLQWLYEQELFGDAFKSTVEQSGDYQPGLFMGRVGANKDDKATVTIMTKDGPKIKTFYAGGAGIGEFAYLWYRHNREESTDSALKLLEVRLTAYEHLKELYTMKDKGLKDGNKELVDEAKRGFQSLEVAETVAKALIQLKLVMGDSESSGDSPQRKQARHQVMIQSTNIFLDMYRRALPRLKLIDFLLQKGIISLGGHTGEPGRQNEVEQRRAIEERLDVMVHNSKEMNDAYKTIKQEIKEGLNTYDKVYERLQVLLPSKEDHQQQRQEINRILERTTRDLERERAERLAAERGKGEAESRAGEAESRAGEAESRAGEAESRAGEERARRLAAESRAEKAERELQELKRRYGELSELADPEEKGTSSSKAKKPRVTLSESKRLDELRGESSSPGSRGLFSKTTGSQAAASTSRANGKAEPKAQNTSLKM